VPASYSYYIDRPSLTKPPTPLFLGRKKLGLALDLGSFKDAISMEGGAYKLNDTKEIKI
jgi:hypothetical protein